MVCLALIGKEPDSFDAVWLARLRLAAPDHPLPDCIDAADALNAGNLHHAKEALARAMAKDGRRDLYLAERMTMLREAAAAAGVDVRTAAFAPGKIVAGVSTFTPVYTAAKNLLRQAADGRMPAQDGAEAAETALALVSHLESGRADPYISTLQAASIRKLALAWLPSDAQLGDSEQTLGEAVLIDNARKGFIGSGERFHAAWSTATTEEVNGYYDQFIAHGEAQAIQWFLERVEFVEQAR